MQPEGSRTQVVAVVTAAPLNATAGNGTALLMLDAASTAELGQTVNVALSLEALLQAGTYQGAVDAGWFGDEWAFRLVKTAAGHTLQSLEVAISPYDARTELGLDLRNDDGVATIGSIAPSGEFSIKAS